MKLITNVNRLGRGVLAVTAVMAMFAVWMVAGPANAETINVPIENAVVKGEPGSTVSLGQADVPADLVGRTCEVTVVVTNQESVNEGNKLVISSDSSSVIVEGIEDAPGSVTTKAGTITLGATINVGVQLGNANITSLGSNLTVTCEPLPPTPPAPTVVTRPNYTG